jgi:hypothetical protein
MGRANNSIAKIKDVTSAGGIKTIVKLEDDTNKLLKGENFKTSTSGGLNSGHLFHNVVMKKNYADKQLVRFQDLNILETFPIYLSVESLLAFTAYTLYGFNAVITYPNGTSKMRGNDISITEPSTNMLIPITGCCEGARVTITSSLLGSGATYYNSLGGPYDATVTVNNGFTSGDGYLCVSGQTYPCFTLTRGLGPIGPVIPPTGDTGTTIDTRKIDIYISTKNVGLYRLLIQTATFGTGTTLSEVQDYNNLRQAVIPELSKEISGLSISSTAVQATIEVPNNAYVAIYLSDPSGSASNLGNMALYSWEENNYQYVSPGNSRASVTYTINTYQIH